MFCPAWLEVYVVESDLHVQKKEEKFKLWQQELRAWSLGGDLSPGGSMVLTNPPQHVFPPTMSSGVAS